MTSITTASQACSGAEPGPVPGARLALILLLLINLFNYIDRQVLAAVEPNIRRDFFGIKDPETGELVKDPKTDQVMEEPNAKTRTGLLSTAFLITYMLTAPIFGALANRMSRWMLVGAGVVIWSLASGGSGLAPVFLALLITRCFVGIGEAVYGPVAPTMIADLYPVKVRGQVLSWFYAAISVGGALGYALGAGVVKVTGDWRWAFFLVVPPGLLLALWCWFMPEPRRGQSDAVTDHPTRPAGWADYRILLRTPSYVLNTLGMTAMTFAMGGLAFWVPEYLEYRREPTFLGLVDSKIAFGGLTALSGLAATLVGGIVGDRLKVRYPGSYFLVSGAAMLLAFPMLLLMIYLPFPFAWLPLVLFVFLLFFNTGPTNTILANVTHPLLRAPGFALNILVIHILGDAISPPIMGAIADHSNMNVAFLFVSALVVIGGLFWLWGARYLERDTARAPHALDDAPSPIKG
jgi:MFS family permease